MYTFAGDHIRISSPTWTSSDMVFLAVLRDALRVAHMLLVAHGQGVRYVDIISQRVCQAFEV